MLARQIQEFLKENLSWLGSEGELRTKMSERCNIAGFQDDKVEKRGPSPMTMSSV